MAFQYRNVWFINFIGIGNGIIIAPILRCFEETYSSVNYYHTENEILANSWFVEKVGLKNLKGFSPTTWRRFKKEDWRAINLFIKDKNIDLIINFRNEGPRYDTGYYQFREEILREKTRLDFWDLNFEVIERRAAHQNLTGDILAFLKAQGINVSGYNPKWLASIRKDKSIGDVGFGIAASQTNKRWPTIKWIELAHKVITNSNQDVILFPGKLEEEIKEAIRVLQAIGQDRCKLVSNFSLKDITLQISKLRCFVSNDTGLLHIATAADVPTVGLYVSTNSEIWSPYNKTNFVACQNSFIKKCLDPKLHCGNCFHYYDTCPAIAKYGDDISSNKVYEIITSLIDL